MLKKILLGLLVVFVGLQFYRPAKNVSAAPSPHDVLVKHPAPAEVSAVLKRACYDCHSNNTRYPWYAEVQPVRWWLDSHITDGKRHLNFSEFGTYTKKRAVDKFEETIDQVEQKLMPLPSYTWGHPEARLTPAEIKALVTWAEAGIERLEDE
jgi:hypothetical protein